MFELFTHASEILTGAGVRSKDGRHVVEQDLGRIEDGAIVRSVRGKGKVAHKIEWVGRTSELPKKYLKLRAKNLKQAQAIVPGLVDCHTHLVFAGNRAQEFADRCAGVSYQEIAARGGGILHTMRATREASASDLFKIASRRVEEAKRFGVRTLEIKSGYGLSIESEMKCLKIVGMLRKKFPEMTFHSTFLGAHAFPPDRTREEYLADLRIMVDRVAKEKLAQSCDVFVDEGYFTAQEGEALLKYAQSKKLSVRVHADEFKDTGSAAMAARLGALSADHLLKISGEGIKALAKAPHTVAVLLPGTAFYLKAPHAPARALLDAGAAVALSTDFNPGTSMTLSLPSIMTIGALYLGMSRAEIFAAVTYNAAKALDLHHDKGTLERGKAADFWVMPFARFEESYYRFAW